MGIELRTNTVLDYKLGTLPTTLASRWQSSIIIGSVPNPNPNLILPTLNDTAYGVGEKIHNVDIKPHFEPAYRTHSYDAYSNIKTVKYNKPI